MSMPPLIVIGPLPPPVHGVAISTALALANPILNNRFEVRHLDTTDARTIENLGRWDFTNVALGLKALAGLARRLRGRKGVVYLPLSENVGGFARDSLFIRLAALVGWKVTVHIRNSTFRDFYGARSRPFQWWIRTTLSRLTSMAVLGVTLRPLFDGLMDSSRIVVVPNGTPEAPQLNEVTDPDLVLYLSNLSSKKGIREGVDAALILVREHPTARVVFVGAWESQELARELKARAAPAKGRIEFRPPITGEAKERLLASCAVLLFAPAWGEGHPRIVLEAICRGLPLVTSDRATIAETVTDGREAFVLPDPVPEHLAARILQLLGDEALRTRMGEAARQRYLAAYTQERADMRLADWLAAVAAP